MRPSVGSTSSEKPLITSTRSSHAVALEVREHRRQRVLLARRAEDVRVDRDDVRCGRRERDRRAAEPRADLEHLLPLPSSASLRHSASLTELSMSAAKTISPDSFGWRNLRARAVDLSRAARVAEGARPAELFERAPRAEAAARASSSSPRLLGTGAAARSASALARAADSSAISARIESSAPRAPCASWVSCHSRRS